MVSDVLKKASGLAIFFLLGLLAAAPAAHAQFSCNAPAQGFSAGVPAGWAVVDNAGNDIVWGDLASCGEAGNYTGGAGGAACVSSDLAGQGELDTELRSPVFSLAGATSASLDFNANYQNFAGSDFLDIDISTNGGSSWTTLVRWNEDHGAFRAAPGEFARIDLSPFLGMSNLMLRWRYYDPNTDDWDWYAQLDDVKLTCPVCAGTVQPDPLADGGFEAGSPSAAWAEASTNFGTPLCSPATCGFSGARNGSWWAFFGGAAGVAETASLQQAMVISPGTANLTFYLWNPESSGNGTDALRVLVDGNQVASIPAGNSIYASGYARVVVDLSAFADGGSHTVRFEATTSGAPTNSNFFVDDVSLSICEPPPTALAVDDVSAAEGGSLTFTVTLAPASANTVTVDYATANGTATAGADYTAASGTLQFLPGETSKTVTVATTDDTLDELDETLSLDLANAINASLADGQGIGTILDNDSSAVSIAGASVTEGNAGTATLSFTVSLSPANSQTVTVDYQTADGSATAGADYTAGSGTVTFAPGETSKTVTVAVLGDLIDEADETLSVTLSNPTNAALGSATAAGTIVDDDTASLAVNDAAVTEGDSGSVNAVFTVSLSTPSSQTVTVQAATADGSATAGVDYTATGPATISFAPGQTSQSFIVPVLGDTLDEADEAFAVNLSGASGAAITDALGAGTIVDDDTSALSVSDATQTEGDSGNSNMAFTVSMAPANSRTVTVQFQTTAGGTATAGTDYQSVAATAVTFLAGETSKTVNVPVVGDTVDESDETVNVSLTSPTIAILDDFAGVGTIVDDDTASLAVNDPSVTEGDSGTANLTFTISLSGASAQTVTVDFQTVAGGTATAGTDYQAVTATPVTFAAGETSKTVTVLINGDMIDEVDETVFASLTNAAGAPVGDASGVGTIVDDDTSNITIGDVTVNPEGNSGTATATLTVTLSKANSRTVTVDYATANGTATTAGNDYVAASGTLTFAAGETSKTFSVTVNGDTIDEDNETILVNLTNAANATITDAQGVITITDDDTSAISVSDATRLEGNSGNSNMVFTISLSTTNSRTVTVQFQTVAGGTATAGTDYQSVAATTVTFLAGETSKTVNVPVVGDTIDEVDETVNVSLTSPTNAPLGDASGVGTIQDDDNASLVINDPSVNEGDSGTVNMVFTLSLGVATDHTVTVTFQTAALGTATAGVDFQSVAATTVTFLAGETTKTVNVPVIGDLIDEMNETVAATLTNAAGAPLGDGNGTGTIVDNDTANMTINDVSVQEPTSGTTPATFTVTLSKQSSHTVTVNYATANGTATAGVDYVAASGTLTFNPGETSKTITVTVNGDTTSEPSETFVVNLTGLTSPTGAALTDGQGVGTIINSTPNIVTPADVSVTEGDVEAPTPDPTITVTLSSASAQTVSVNYAVASGTAVLTHDYFTASGTLTFNPGETQKSFTMPLARDKRPEQTEKFFINFSNPVGGLLPDNQVVVTILDDDHNYSLYGGANSNTIAGCFNMADVAPERGAAYMSKPFSLTHKLDMTFAVSFGKYDTTGGGGLVWLLAPTHQLGNDDMGYGFVSPSVGVEMDTVNNYNADPAEDHIAVDENGATPLHNGHPPVQASATSANIEDNLEHELRIVRDPAINRLDVYFDGSLRLSYYKDIVNQIFSGNPTVYWGFTGANNCNDSVCPNNLLYWCPVALCVGDTATPHLLVSDIQVSEGNTGNQTATFTVKLYCPRNEVVTVNYATADGTAVAGLDYLAAAGTLVFNPGETQKTVSVTVYPDPTTEPDETFLLNLSGASANLATPDTQAVAKILDDVRFVFGLAGDIPLMGDWNGDGIDTPGVFRNGTFYLRNSNTTGVADISFNFGTSTDIPVVGDWNGDGIDTVGIWNGAFFYLKTANTAAAGTTTVFLGQSGDQPLAGDWNANGVDTVGVRRGGTFILSNTSSGTWDVVFNYGLATDVPVIGDWNNDGTDTIGVFRDGTFFLRNSNTTGVGEITINYGVFQDKPLAADIDGDGDDNVGYFRNGTFAVKK
ncbi:MAG TPA: Calx-beta domain-containing protein [Thermoanaerobaculia bacterium]